MALAYTKKLLIQRIKQHIANDFPTDSFSTSDNEVLLYIDQAIAFSIVGQAYANAKVEGALAVNEAWLVTFKLGGLLQDNVTGYWYQTLPQPPVGLPLGYSINDVYFGQAGLGKSMPIYPIKAKRVSYRNMMPLPTGARYWVEGNKIWIVAADGSSLLDIDLYVQMPSSRTADVNDLMNVPDDAIEQIFTNVVNKLVQREQLPKDIIQDDISVGNSNVQAK